MTDDTTAPYQANPGFIKAMRHPDGLELLRKNRNAFGLLYVIASRARWSPGFNCHDLELGEALIGDHANYGLTEQEYRTAKKDLAKCGFATFKGTSKGTIARIVNTRVFDINVQSANGQANDRSTDCQRTANGPPTDNQRLTKKGRTKERKNERKGERTPEIASPEETELAAFRETVANSLPSLRFKIRHELKGQLSTATNEAKPVLKEKLRIVEQAIGIKSQGDAQSKAKVETSHVERLRTPEEQARIDEECARFRTAIDAAIYGSRPA